MKKGLTLIELLMAIFLLFITSTFIMQLFISSAHYSQRSKEQATALLLAQSKLESILPGFNLTLIRQQGNFAPQYTEYLYKVEITNDEGNMRLIRVTVTSPMGVAASLRALR